jgi:hypothetical protein
MVVLYRGIRYATSFDMKKIVIRVVLYTERSKLDSYYKAVHEDFEIPFGNRHRIKTLWDAIKEAKSRIEKFDPYLFNEIELSKYPSEAPVIERIVGFRKPSLDTSVSFEKAKSIFIRED